MFMIYLRYVESICNKFFDHELYGLTPKGKFSRNYITFTDDLPNRIITGITLKVTI